MKNLFKFIKNLFSLNKLDLPAKKVVADHRTLSDLLATTFIDIGLAQDIKRDLIASIISNGFIADPMRLLIYFKNNYDFTINEFIILSYKLGMLSKIYVGDATLLLQDALKLDGIFPKDVIDQLKNMLEQQMSAKDEEFRHRIKLFNAQEEENKKDSSFKNENDIADELIDKWLKNKNK